MQWQGDDIVDSVEKTALTPLSCQAFAQRHTDGGITVEFQRRKEVADRMIRGIEAETAGSQEFIIVAEEQFCHVASMVGVLGARQLPEAFRTYLSFIGVEHFAAHGTYARTDDMPYVMEKVQEGQEFKASQ